MNIKKEDNQYFGQYIEEAVNAYINKTPIVNNTGHSFSFEEIDEMNQDAFLIASFLKGTTSQYTGRKTTTTNGDLVVDNQVIELKYVSQGAGTYLNTSIEYFHSRLGFSSFKDYTKKELLPFLAQYFGTSVYDNLSPVSQSMSKEIRHNQPNLYKEIQKIDKKMRKEYVEDLYSFLCLNPDKLQLFVSDMLSKNIGTKQLPDKIIVFNYLDKTIRLIDNVTILSFIQNKQFKKNPLGLVFDNFRVAIGWQNGNGLNNPTIRVFIK